MALSWTLTNLGEIIKQLGGLKTQGEIYPMLLSEGYMIATSVTYSRLGAVLTGYTDKPNISEDTETVILVGVSITGIHPGPEVLYNDGLSESWEVGSTMKPKYILTFTR